MKESSDHDEIIEDILRTVIIEKVNKLEITYAEPEEKTSREPSTGSLPSSNHSEENVTLMEGPVVAENVQVSAATEEQDIELSQTDLNEMPDRLRMEQYDILVITSTTDVQSGVCFKELLETLTITVPDSVPEKTVQVKACVTEGTADLCEAGSKIATLGEGLERCTFVFLLVTPSFVTDAWAAYQKDEALMSSVDDKDRRWSIVPIFTVRKQELDSSKTGFRSVKGLDMSKALGYRELIDFETLIPEEINERDRYFLPHLRNMITKGIGKRLSREEVQKNDRDGWIRGKKREARLKRMLEESNAEEEKENEKRKIEELRQHLASRRRSPLPQPQLPQQQQIPPNRPHQGELAWMYFKCAN